MVRRVIAVDHLIQTIAPVRRRSGGNKVPPVDAHLHRARIGRRQSGALRHGTAQYLQEGILAVQVHFGDVLPEAIARNVQPIIRHRRLPAARAANPRAAVVSHLRPVAVAMDEGRVHLRIRLPNVEVGQFRALCFSHYKFHHRLHARVNPIIHLVKRVGRLGERAVHLLRRRGPRARIRLAIRGLHIEFDHREIWLHRQDHAVNRIARYTIVVLPVIEHR